MNRKGFRYSLFSLLLLLAVLLTACGGGESADSASYGAPAGAYDMAEGAVAMKSAGPEAMEYEEAFVSNSSGTASEVKEQASGSRKLIKDMDMSVETQEFDGLLQKLEKQVEELGGYVESSNTYNGSSYGGKKALRNASYTVRIPAEKLDQFVAMIEGTGNVTNKSLSVRDITLTYVDLESHRNALREEEKQLLLLMEEATTIDELISIRNSLTDVRYQLESMESQLRTYDNLVSYSTVTLSINEVESLTPVEPKGAFERITEGFMENLDDTLYDISEFFINLLINLPAILWFLVRLAVCVAILAGIIRLIFGNKEKREARRAEKEKKRAEKEAEKQRLRAEKEAKKQMAGGMTPNVPGAGQPDTKGETPS